MRAGRVLLLVTVAALVVAYVATDAGRFLSLDVIRAQQVIQLAENAYYYGHLMDNAPEQLSDGLKQIDQSAQN